MLGYLSSPVVPFLEKFCSRRFGFSPVDHIHEVFAKKNGSHLELPEMEVGTLETSYVSKLTAIVGHS
jgi:hypothetical protein